MCPAIRHLDLSPVGANSFAQRFRFFFAQVVRINSHLENYGPRSLGRRFGTISRARCPVHEYFFVDMVLWFLYNFSCKQLSVNILFDLFFGSVAEETGGVEPNVLKPAARGRISR
jgi:hypothetical protein